MEVGTPLNPERFRGIWQARRPPASQTRCLCHASLMQTVRDQTTGAFQKLSIFLAECVQLITLHVQHAENMPMLISHRDNDL